MFFEIQNDTYDYTLIYRGEEVILASKQVDGIITHKYSPTGVIQFKKGENMMVGMIYI